MRTTRWTRSWSGPARDRLRRARLRPRSGRPRRGAPAEPRDVPGRGGRREQVTFINSDPGLILLFLAWLDQIEFPAEHRHLSLSIHESADVGAATAWWADLVRLSPDAFAKAALKKHNPKTVRLNVGDAYVGCLVIRLRQCRRLYQQIEGVWQGIMGALPARSAP